MKIFQLAPVWETVPPPGYGGTEAVISVLTEELVRRGHEVTLCASGDSCTHAKLLSVVPRSLRPAGLTGVALQYSTVHVAFALKEARNCDIVHNHAGPPSELGMALSHLSDVPMLTTLHNQLTQETQFIWKNYLGWYNAISHEQASTLPSLPRAHFAGVVHNGIDVTSFPFQSEKEDYLLFIGRITAAKAPHLAIAAAREVGMKIIIAGVAMPEERHYFKEVLEPMLDGRQAVFVGEADARLKRALYAGARALLLPLQWEEPFGLVMIEAMACGTPPIVFRCGAAKEIVADGETGFLVKDVDEMVAAVHRLDSISPWRCRAWVEERFSPAALAGGYLAIYEKILGLREPVFDRSKELIQPVSG